MIRLTSVSFVLVSAFAFIACGNPPLGPGDTVPGSIGGAGATPPSSGGGPASGAASEACAGRAVSWKTDVVSLHADDFWILANGTCYTTAGAAVQVHSDPGTPTYDTLELTWNEHDREMRLFIYFSADSSGWWSTEMRTYDGGTGYNADWLYYYGTFFRSPIGKTFTGDVDLSNDAADTIRGRLHLGGLSLSNSLRGN